VDHDRRAEPQQRPQPAQPAPRAEPRPQPAQPAQPAPTIASAVDREVGNIEKQMIDKEVKENEGKDEQQEFETP